MNEEAALDNRIQSLLSIKATDEQVIIHALNDIVKDFGIDKVQRWCYPQSRSKNMLIHEFARRGSKNVIEHAVQHLGFNVNVKRESDGNTPLQLAEWYGQSDVSKLLRTLGADSTIANNYGEVADELAQLREKTLNLVWLDIEVTSHDNPHILECAVIVTDKDLNELERGHWVLHYQKAELDQLSDFHQNVYKSSTDGGNGLFDDVLASKTTHEEMSYQLLELIKRHCPEKFCRLAGSSVHQDREVLRSLLPSVFDYLEYRIIDVNTIFALVERWSSVEARVQKEDQLYEIMKNKYNTNNKGGQVHRALYDIERTIELLKLFKPLFAAL